MAGALSSWLFLASLCVSVLQEHTHEHATDGPVERPKVFLDKSPKIVEYQLKRLDNSRLLLVEREPTDKKYAPVYRAILLRPGMSRQDREESLGALTKINERMPSLNCSKPSKHSTRPR